MRSIAALLILLICAACAPVAAGDPYALVAAGQAALTSTAQAQQAAIAYQAAQSTQLAAMATAQQDEQARVILATQSALDAQARALTLQQTAQAISQAQADLQATQTAQPIQATASATAALATAEVVRAEQDAKAQRDDFIASVGAAIFWLVFVVVLMLLIIGFPVALKIATAWASAKADELQRRSLVREGPGGLALIYLLNTYVPALDAGRLLERSITPVAHQAGPKVTDWIQNRPKPTEPQEIQSAEYIEVNPGVNRAEILMFVTHACQAGDQSSNIIPGWRRMKQVNDRWNSTPWQNVVEYLKEQGFVETDPGKETRVVHGTLADLRNQIVFRGRVPDPLEMADF